jgi:hypothetical protein
MQILSFDVGIAVPDVVIGGMVGVRWEKRCMMHGPVSVMPYASLALSAPRSLIALLKVSGRIVVAPIHQNSDSVYILCIGISQELI